MEVGDLITLYRKQAGMTIDHLAAVSGVPKGTLNKIIGGVTKAPTLSNMKAIASALGKTLADFDEPKEEQPAEDSELSKLEDELVIEFRNLPDFHKGLAAALCLAVIRELVKHQTVGIEAQSSVPAGSNR